MQVVMDSKKNISASQISAENTYGNVASKQRTVSKSYNGMDIFHHRTESDSNLLGVKTLQDQGKTMDEIQSLASVMDIDTYQDKMVIMSNSVSEKDLGEIFEDGFSAQTMSVDDYVTIVDRIKITEAKCGKIIAGYNDNLSSDDLQAALGDTAIASLIKNELEKAGLQATEENLKQVSNAVFMGRELETPEESTKKYLVENNLYPTIENLFTAQFSGSKSVRENKFQYERNQTGYYTQLGNRQTYTFNDSEIEKVLDKNGIKLSDETIKNARWMICEGIEVSQKSMKLALTVDQLSLPLSDEEMIATCVKGLMDGKNAKETDLYETDSLGHQALSYMKRFGQVSENVLHEVVKKNIPCTLQSLENMADTIIDETDINTDGSEQFNQAFLTAKRKLEEVRLFMTAEANRTLLKAGISIDTTELSKLVDALKYAEKEYAKKLFPDMDEESALESKSAYEEAIQIEKRLPQLPISLVNAVFERKDNITLKDYYEEGRKASLQMKMAKESYETYMTVIRSDLGDHIEQAFSNLKELLNEAQIPESEMNLRAARILGYNHLEITKENIEVVKLADEKLSYVLEELNPAMTLQMIRKGENPIKMDIDELIEKIDAYQDNPETEHMRFSRFLYGLDQRNDITKEERKEFLDVYRVLKQVEKTKGAPIGALLATGAELNLSNLKQATSASKKTMDYSIKNGEMSKSQFAREIKSVSHQISANVLKELKNAKKELDQVTLTELKETIKMQDRQELYKLFMKQEQDILEEAQGAKSEYANALESLGEPVTVMNLVAYESLIENFGEIYKNGGKLWSKERTDVEETQNDLSKEFLEEIEDFPESFAKEDILDQKYEGFLTKMQDSIMQSIEKADGYIDLKQMMLLGKQVGILKAMEKRKEYEIPMLVKGELTSVHISFEKSNMKGMVSIMTSLDDASKVRGEFRETNGVISGYVVTDAKDNIEELENILERMQGQLIEQKFNVDKFNVIWTKESELYRNTEVTNGKTKTTNQTLYQIAKAFLTSL